MMTTRILGIAALLVMAAVPAKAQQGCARTAPYAEEARQTLVPLFYSADATQVAVRGTAIQRLSASDTNYVVRTDSVCDQVLSTAVALMRQHSPVWSSGAEGNYVATVYRFGSYYVVGLAEERPAVTGGLANGVENGRSVTLVYSATLMLLRVVG
jgi:hypothetical protein